MDSLTSAELLELLLLSEAAVDYQVEFWLTVSFATIVASFAARHLLTKKIRWLVSFLYLASTFVFVSRWYYNAFDALVYNEVLVSRGIEMPVGYVSGVARMILFLAGTLATVYFLNTRIERKDS